jgi:hypothetical protein
VTNSFPGSSLAVSEACCRGGFHVKRDTLYYVYEYIGVNNNNIILKHFYRIIRTLRMIKRRSSTLTGHVARTGDEKLIENFGQKT